MMTAERREELDWSVVERLRSWVKEEKEVNQIVANGIHSHYCARFCCLDGKKYVLKKFKITFKNAQECFNTINKTLKRNLVILKKYEAYFETSLGDVTNQDFSRKPSKKLMQQLYKIGMELQEKVSELQAELPMEYFLCFQ